jgi:hypothetical protein
MGLYVWFSTVDILLLCQNTLKGGIFVVVVGWDSKTLVFKPVYNG